MRSYEKCRTFNFFHCFWLEIERNLVMADLVSLFEGVCTFFLWKYLILLHFLNLKTPTDDSRLRHGRDFETPFLHRAAVTGLMKLSSSYLESINWKILIEFSLLWISRSVHDLLNFCRDLWINKLFFNRIFCHSKKEIVMKKK